MIVQVIILLLMFSIMSGATGIGMYLFKDGVNYFSIAFLIISVLCVIFLFIKHFIIGRKMKHRELNIVDMLRFMIAFIMISITIAGFLYDINLDMVNLEIAYIISAAALIIVLIWRVYDRIAVNNMNKRKKATFNTITVLPGIIMMTVTYLSFFESIKTGIRFLGISLIFMLISLVVMMNSYPKGVLRAYKNDPIEKTGKVFSIITLVIVIGIVSAGGYFVYDRFIKDTKGENVGASKETVSAQTSSAETQTQPETKNIEKSESSTAEEAVKNEDEDKEEEQLYAGTLYNSWSDSSKIECIEGNTSEFITDGIMINDNHPKVLKVNLKTSYNGSPEDFRTKILYDGENLSLSSYINNKYLIFDIFNETEGAEGSPFVALRDSKGNQIAGWCENFTADSSEYDNKIGSGTWKTICVDLLSLQGNETKENGVWKPESFDFNSITSIWIGYWAKGDIYIDNVTFSDVIP